MNKFFLLLVAAFLAVALVLYFTRRARRRVPIRERKFFGALQAAGAGALLGVYLILLCSAVGAEYIRRSDVLLGFGFYFFFAHILCGIYVSKRVPLVVLLLPLILCGLFFETNTQSRTFAESNAERLDPKKCIAISEDIVHQFIETEKSGADEITLYVPRFQSNVNWPLPDYATLRITRTLYKHGIIRERLRPVATIPSNEKNKELGIPLPEAGDMP